MATIIDQNDGVGRALTGAEGENDHLDGMDGDDTLRGLDGDDELLGGEGDDEIWTGEGRDIVHFQHDAFGALDFGNDFALDFDPDRDVIDVSGLGDGFGSGSLGIGSLETVRAIAGDSALGLALRWGSSSLFLSGLSADYPLKAAQFSFARGGIADVLVLGGGHDIIAANDFADFLDGGGGNDTLFGEAHDDTVLGGDGNDSLYGGAGRDVVRGDNGKDTLFGGAGDDSLNGGAGDDMILGGAGRDLLALGHDAASGAHSGRDIWADFNRKAGDRVDAGHLGGLSGTGLGVSSFETLKLMGLTAEEGGTVLAWGGARLVLGGVQKIVAGAFLFNKDISADKVAFGGKAANLAALGLGDDSASGGQGADTLFGEGGNDTLDGGAGADSLHGGDGRDVLKGGASDDTLGGGADGDTLDGGLGGDTMAGGAGDDTYYVDQTDYVFNPFLTFDRIVEEAGAKGGIDRVIVAAPEYTLEANVENAEITSRSGPDWTGSWGGSGAFGRDGLPVVLRGNGLDNQLVGSDTKARVEQWIFGAAGNDAISGLGGQDFLSGDAGRDNLDGGSGDDTVLGGEGRDTLSGGAGHDLLIGNAGFSVRGDRILPGEAGEDHFIFDAAPVAANSDTISGFDDRDFILLDSAVFTSLGGESGRAIAKGNFVAGTQAKDADDFIIYDSGTGRLWYDADGNGAGAKALIAEIYAETKMTVKVVPPSFTAPYGLEFVYTPIAAAGLDRLDILLL